jgi:crossover junction endodeoxyribonuclease RuvC
MPISKIKIILGIDPGLATSGFGLISQTKDGLKLIEAGLIKTSAQKPVPERLQSIHYAVNKIIKKFRPDIVAIEQLFFCRNVKSALAVGQARGVIILACAQNKVVLEEFTPLQVKQALCGYGQATKKQIQIMVKNRLSIKNALKSDDLADALAIAICSAQTKKWR